MMVKKQAKQIDKQDHRSLALWAADCAEHVLPHFEKMYSDDARPRKAIEAGRAWQVRCLPEHLRLFALL